MFTEKPMIEAVAAFFDNVPVYVDTGKEDDVLFPIEIFKMEELKKGGYRYVVDMPELPEEIERRLGRQLEQRKKKERKSVPEKAGKDGGKTLGETVYEMRKQGLSYKEIADVLGRDVRGLSSICSAYKKKQKGKDAKGLDAEEAAKPGNADVFREERYIQETVKLTSTITGKPTTVDMKKARALRDAGWSMEKTADEFNVSVEDLEELLA